MPDRASPAPMRTGAERDHSIGGPRALGPRWVVLLICLAGGWLAPTAAAAEDPTRATRVVLRIAGERDRALLARARGQASDLPLVLVPVEVPALEPSLGAQAAAAPVLARQLGARGVIWFAPAPEGGIVVHTWQARGADVVVRAVEGERRDGDEALSSATLEATALVVRTALRALIEGDRRAVPIAVSLPVSATMAADPGAGEGPAWSAALGPLWIDDGVTTRGALGLGLGAGLVWPRLAVELALAATWPTAATDDLTKLRLSRGSFTLGAFGRARFTRRFVAMAGLRAGAAVFLRSTEALQDGVVPRAVSRTWSPLLAPELGLRAALGAGVGLVLSVATDVLPQAPTLGYARAGGIEGQRSLWRVQPRLGLCLILGGG